VRRARSAALALTFALFAAAPSAAQAGWGKPFELVKPGSLDYLPTQLAFSPSGSAAAAFGILDVDTPGSSQAYLVSRSARGAVGRPRSISGAREVLALGFDGPALELLTGASPNGLDCCSSAQATRITARGVVQRSQTVVGGLAGAALGQLVTLADGQMLAAVATERGVWTLQSRKGNRFAGKRRLTAAGQAPESLTASWLGGENSVVAWTSASGPAGSADPRSIFFSLGSKQGGPRRAHTLLSVAVGHRIDELAVARRASGATAAWVESWYDSHGNYHSQVKAADFGSRPGIRALSPAGGLAAGVAFAADAQGVAWKTCTSNGSCTVHAATRGPSAKFGAAVSLGSIDASQSPALTVGPRGQVVVGWVRSGHPVAVVGSAANGDFGVTRVLSASAYALDMTVAFGPRRDALAAWTQGTLDPSVVAASYRAP
jgi:hypothetical protein